MCIVTAGSLIASNSSTSDHATTSVILGQIISDLETLRANGHGATNRHPTILAITSNTTLTSNSTGLPQLVTVTSSSAVTVTLPSSPTVGDYWIIWDLSRNSETYNITIALNSGQSINGITTNQTINANGTYCIIHYVASNTFIANFSRNDSIIKKTAYKLDTYKSRFSEYGRWFKSIRTFDSTETFTADNAGTSIADNTTVGQFSQGTGSKKLTASATGAGAIRAYSNVSLNLALFGDGVTVSNPADYIEISFYIEDITKFEDSGGAAIMVWFYVSSGSKFGKRARYTRAKSTLVSGDNTIRGRKNDFTYDSSFVDADWASLAGVYIYVTTNDTAAAISPDNLILIPSVLSPYRVLGYGGTSNSDSTSGTTFTTSTNRLESLNLLTPNETKLAIYNSSSGGYGEDYSITNKSGNTLTTATLPTIASNVEWRILEPEFVEKDATFTYVLEDSANRLKLASADIYTAAAKIALLNQFKPDYYNYNFYIRAHFQLIASVQNQGFCLFYKDTSNYVIAYIYKNGASSVFKIDKVVAGSPTNLYTSSTFTTADNDEIIMIANVYGNTIDLYASTVNTFTVSLNKSLDFYDSTFNNYQAHAGFYSDKALRVLYVEAGCDRHFINPKNNGFVSGTFATSNTLTITDNRINKSSMITYQIKSAPVGSIYLNSINAGTVVFTSSSASETAVIHVEIWN